MKKIKRLTALLLTLCLLTTLLPTVALAATEYTEGYYTYTVSNGEATIVDCSDYIQGNISIPSMLGGYPVTCIGDNAFYNANNLTNVVIPTSVITIGSSAFYSCDSLVSVNIPNSANSIGNEAFQYCSSLARITIPKGVKMIGDAAFYDCTNLATVIFSSGSSLNIIGEKAFYNCSILSSVTIPNSVMAIGKMAFYSCDNLTKVSIGNSVANIGDSAFAYCYELTSITIPESITCVGSSAFTSCNSLVYTEHDEGKYLGNNNNPYLVFIEPTSSRITSCTIHARTKVIADSAFYGHSYLTSVSISDNVIAISDRVFYSCNNLTDVNIGIGVTSIGDYAFYDCDNLKSITIPSGVIAIGESSFAICSDLCNISIPNSISMIGESAFKGCSKLVYNIYDNAIYLGNSKDPYVVLVDTTSDVISSCKIHSKTCLIYRCAFENCDNLSSILIPDSVVCIDYKAFYSCDNLNSINIGNCVQSIGSYAFQYCSNLISVSIGNSVVEIGNHTFEYCYKLADVKIPKSMVNIGDRAFNGCSKLWHILYEGSQSEWRAIHIGSDNNNLNKATIHYNCSGNELVNYKMRYCSICEPNCSHAWDNYTIIKKPTVKEEGVVTYTCYICTATITETVPKITFMDVSASSWMMEFVAYAYDRGLMSGKREYSNSRVYFDPNSPITREEFVQVLYNAEGKPSVTIDNKFPDVADNGWYKSAVLWANSKNIANGLGNGNFGVGKNISRQDLAMMLYKYAKLKGCSLDAEEGRIDQFADGDKVADYAKTAMNWAVTNTILSGKGTAGADISTFYLDPAGTATRAECAAMLKNFMTAFGL